MARPPAAAAAVRPFDLCRERERARDAPTSRAAVVKEVCSTPIFPQSRGGVFPHHLRLSAARRGASAGRGLRYIRYIHERVADAVRKPASSSYYPFHSRK